MMVAFSGVVMMFDEKETLSKLFQIPFCNWSMNQTLYGV